MTVEEIFDKLSSHMMTGVAFHAEMAKAYEFLGLWGFAKCHLSHCFEENKEYFYFNHYYAAHYFKLLPATTAFTIDLIPTAWYKYTTQAVDSSTLKSSVKELMTKWIEWEKKTKKLYQEMRQELTALGEIGAAIILDKYICDVTKELSHAEKKTLKLEAMGYDIEYILYMAEEMEKKYTKKLGW